MAAMLFYTNLIFAQDIAAADVPSVVKNAFNRSFPKSYHVEWEQKGDTYNAEFDIDWRDHEVWISNTGAILKHKKEIRIGELPAAVAAQIKQTYNGYRADDADQYEVNKQFYYKVELKQHDAERKVIFDRKGKVSNIIL